jgi:tRNA threonylcarbamoyladenosine biosynthesis protein TsaB
MMLEYTLAMDASTYAGSVAIFRDTELLAEKILPESSGPMRGTREEAMMPAVLSALTESGVEKESLTRIVCGEGPGSFTSLRISASLAKGFAHSLSLPLYSVSSLLLIAANCAKSPGMYAAALSAMRGESYAALFHLSEGGISQTGSIQIIADDRLEEFANGSAAKLLRVGSEPAIRPRIGAIPRILTDVIGAGPVDLASWEPKYGRLAEAQVRWEKATGRKLVG